MHALPLRFLNAQAVREAGGLDVLAAMADVRDALALWRAGDAEMPAEVSVALGDGVQSRAYALAARLGGAVGLAGVKWTAHRPALADGAPPIVSLTAVTDAATGLPVGIVESAQLTATRTAAVSALALQHGASGPVRRVAVLGAGVQAAAHLRMLAAVFPGLERVMVWNRTPHRVPALLAAVEVPWPAMAADRIGDAVADADAILCCTAAAEPILGVNCVRPGRMVVQAGYHEVSFDAIAASDTVLVDLWGEFRLSSAKSLFQMHRAGRFAADGVAADLPALVLDGWRPRSQASVYFSSFGLNLFDVALAGRVLRQAAAQGLGTVLPLGAYTNLDADRQVVG